MQNGQCIEIINSNCTKYCFHEVKCSMINLNVNGMNKICKKKWWRKQMKKKTSQMTRERNYDTHNDNLNQ